MLTWNESWQIIEPLATERTDTQRAKTELVWRLARESGPGAIIELGCHRGAGAIALALGSGTRHKVYTIDDFQSREQNGQVFRADDLEIARKNTMDRGIEIIVADMHSVPWNGEPVSLVIRDVADPKAATLVEDLAFWSRFIPSGGRFIFRCPTNVGMPVLKRSREWNEWRLLQDYPEAAVRVLEKRPAVKRAAFWIVTEKYLPEAKRSAASFSEHMPHVERWLCSPDECEVSPLFPHFLRLPPRCHDQWYVDLMRWMPQVMEAIPADQVMNVDSDTVFLDEVIELYELLDHFDLAGIHAVARRTGPTIRFVPDSFPELNTGLLPMRNIDAVRQAWGKSYDLALTRPELPHTDQAMLRDVLWHDFSGRIGVFPPEYHCRYEHGGLFVGRVRVLHGRGNLPRTLETINVMPGPGTRLWSYQP